MIYGIGTDICDVRRIRATLERHGERFARKVLSDGEFAVWQGPQRALAGARRALPGHPLFRQGGVQQGRRPGHAHADDLAPVRDRQPAQRQAGHRAARRLKEWFEAQGLTAHVTVTDETDYAASFVVVEKKED